jgi:hypothetical protein
MLAPLPSDLSRPSLKQEAAATCPNQPLLALLGTIDNRRNIMDRAESIRRRKERLPWSRDEIRLWIDEFAESLDEWDAIIGEPPKGSELWEFKQVLGEVTSKLSRLSFSLHRCGMESAEPTDR